MMVPWLKNAAGEKADKKRTRDESWSFSWFQLWPTRWDAIESSCLKRKMSWNILEHTSWQELTWSPFLNWTGLGKSIIPTSSLAIDSWDHFGSRDRMDILVRLDCFGPWETRDVTDVHSEDFNFFKRLLRTTEAVKKEIHFPSPNHHPPPCHVWKKKIQGFPPSGRILLNW